MKWNKFFMLGVAGLALCACSNEDEVTNTSLPTGEGAVTVRIVSPALTKSVAEGTTGSSVKVEGTLTIKVTHNNNQTLTKDVTIGSEATDATVTFWNVTSPTKVEAYMNNGVESYSDIAIAPKGSGENDPDLQAMPKSIPVYGSATPALTGTTDNGVTEDDGSNENANSDKEDPNRTFQMYSATVSLEIPVARLEMSGITHVDHTGSSCEFTDLQITGVYLDNLLATGGALSRSNYVFPDDNETTTEPETPLYDAINPTEDFTSTGTWPKVTTGITTPVYAYNFYAPADDETINNGMITEEISEQYNPHFKVRFTYTEGEAPNTTIQTRYAMITKYTYTSGGFDYLVMRKGHIYKINAAAISDDNIVPGEDGEDLYALTVTVEEAEWTVNTVYGAWETGNN